MVICMCADEAKRQEETIQLSGDEVRQVQKKGKKGSGRHRRVQHGAEAAAEGQGYHQECRVRWTDQRETITAGSNHCK